MRALFINDLPSAKIFKVDDDIAVEIIGMGWYYTYKQGYFYEKGHSEADTSGFIEYVNKNGKVSNEINPKTGHPFIELEGKIDRQVKYPTYDKQRRILYGPKMLDFSKIIDDILEKNVIDNPEEAKQGRILEGGREVIKTKEEGVQEIVEQLEAKEQPQ